MDEICDREELKYQKDTLINLIQNITREDNEKVDSIATQHTYLTIPVKEVSDYTPPRPPWHGIKPSRCRKYSAERGQTCSRKFNYSARGK